nr:hypothetical protein CFP56_07349 [Quercus suber]
MPKTKLRSSTKGFPILKLSLPRPDRRVQETEVCLADELAKIYRDYCQEVWVEALNLVGVPATLEWRKAENIYYPVDIPEVLAALPSPATLAPISSEQPSITQASLPLVGGGSRPEDKGKGKEVKPLPEAKGPAATLKLKDTALKAKDAVPKAKEADLQSKEADPKAPNPPVSQPGSKENPHLAKVQL